MGCINTKRVTSENQSLRVSVVRLQPDTPTGRNGILELTPRELSFITHGRGPLIVWTLQHLRRYGVNGDVFSFEAGRRCMTGPGIYKFRCDQADRLYQLFQRYINAVSLVADENVLSERELEHPSHTLGRPDFESHANNYLEPIRNVVHESFGQNTLNLELDNRELMPSVSLATDDVQFQHQNPSTPASFTGNYNTNVYLEHPLRGTSDEHNNNTSNDTLLRKSMSKQISLDVPPEECAPIDALHMYANVEGLGTRDPDRTDSVERCYENLGRLDFPKLQPPPTTQRDSSREHQQPATRSVNYIVLDLDQPRSPAQISPKTCFGSGLSLESSEPSKHSTENNFLLPSFDRQLSMASSNTTTKQEYHQLGSLQKKADSSLGYSTIDFIKTCALIKSSTHGADFDHDNEESRITRHSKCVRKAYSISE